MTNHLDALTLGAWADGLTPPDERQRVAAHLAECARCRSLAAGQAQMAQWLLHLPPESPPPLLARAIAASVSRRRRSEVAWARLATVSGAAALLGLGLMALALPDVARLLPALAAVSAPGTSVTALFDLPAGTLAGLAGSTVDWASTLTGGAGVTLLVGLVLLAGAAFGALAQLLRPGVLDSVG